MASELTDTTFDIILLLFNSEQFKSESCDKDVLTSNKIEVSKTVNEIIDEEFKYLESMFLFKNADVFTFSKFILLRSFIKVTFDEFEALNFNKKLISTKLKS